MVLFCIMSIARNKDTIAFCNIYHGVIPKIHESTTVWMHDEVQTPANYGLPPISILINIKPECCESVKFWFWHCCLARYVVSSPDKLWFHT